PGRRIVAAVPALARLLLRECQCALRLAFAGRDGCVRPGRRGARLRRRPVGCLRPRLARQPPGSLRPGAHGGALMLEARRLHKVYRGGSGSVPAVVDVSLQVAPGEFLVICGRSGSGKSTLLGMLGGLCRPSQGTVTLDGVEVWSQTADALAEFRNRKVGFLF